MLVVLKLQWSSHSLIYVSAKYRHFYGFIQTFYDNNLGGPVIMKHGVVQLLSARCRAECLVTSTVHGVINQVVQRVNFRFIYGAIFGPLAVCRQARQPYTIFSPAQAARCTTARHSRD